jgi:hypothetical protein
MKATVGTFGVLLILAFVFSRAAVFGEGEAPPKGKRKDLRQRLASLRAGMTSEQVLKALGKPDEIRRVPEGGLLDGTRLLGDVPGTGPETERWAYGILGKGKFASVGYVSIDRNGKVVGAVPADCFAYASWKPHEQVAPKTDRAVESPAKLSCHLEAVQPTPAEGQPAATPRVKITLKNSGTERFELKHDAAYTLVRFVVVEIYDSTGTMLFRDDGMRYHSPISADPARWPTLSIPPNKDLSHQLSVNPAHGFGPLPPGRYSVRAYFPFEKGRYYPSNLVRFEVK